LTKATGSPLEEAAADPPVGPGVGVQPGDEDDAGDAVVEQRVDVLLLADASRALLAQHRGEPLLGQHPVVTWANKGKICC
jgi:hypothetical protein